MLLTFIASAPHHYLTSLIGFNFASFILRFSSQMMCPMSNLGFIRRLFTGRHTTSSNSSNSPPSVSWLLEHREELRKTPATTHGNTPTESLYRMYQYTVTSSTIDFRNEVEYFFNQASWAVCDIPDPKDYADPARYAIVAVLPYHLVKAFNRLIERGLPRDSPCIITSVEMEEELKSRKIVREVMPEWTKHVPRLEETLVIPPPGKADGEAPDEDDRSPLFVEMNIIVQEPHALFV